MAEVQARSGWRASSARSPVAPLYGEASTITGASLAALPGFTLHSDMSPARLFYAHDLVDPTFDIRPDGRIAVPARAGNGFPVVPERVADATIRSWNSDGRACAAP